MRSKTHACVHGQDAGDWAVRVRALLLFTHFNGTGQLHPSSAAWGPHATFSLEHLALISQQLHDLEGSAWCGVSPDEGDLCVGLGNPLFSWGGLMKARQAEAPLFFQDPRRSVRPLGGAFILRSGQPARCVRTPHPLLGRVVQRLSRLHPASRPRWAGFLVPKCLSSWELIS